MSDTVTSEPINLATKFFEGFVCNKNELANVILSWFEDVFGPTITIILGPRNSGKTALVRVAQKMLLPHAVRSHGGEMVKSETAKTCFYEEDTEILSDINAVNEHPCMNLVFTCLEDPGLGSNFGVYEVHYLRLGQIVNPDSKIVDTMMGPEYSNDCLEWCFKNRNKK